MSLAGLETPQGRPKVQEQVKHLAFSDPQSPVESSQLTMEDEKESGIKIAGLRKELEEKEPSLVKEVLQKVHPNLIATLKEGYLDEEMRQLEQEFKQDPTFAELFREVYLNENDEALKEKTSEQIRQLESTYYGETNWRHPLALYRKRKKLQAFREFVNSLKPVRKDANAGLTTFMSPRALGVSASFGAPDVIVQADKYVYGSFDKIRHHMTGSEGYAAILDEEDVKPHAQIVMQDIANMGTAGLGNSETKYRDYLKNTFDYEGGKELLSVYLASVFDLPEEAQNFFKNNNHPQQAQNWKDEWQLHLPMSTGQAPDRDAEQEHLQGIVSRMKHILEATAIQPPMSLEVRIPGEAKKIGMEQ